MERSIVYCIEVSRIYLVAKIEVKVVTVVNSVDILMLSLDLDNVFVQGYITRNIFFVGVLYCSEFDRRTKSW